MVNKKLKEKDRIVYSTNPDFFNNVEEENIAESLPPDKQQLRVNMERKGRGGKTVTLVHGFVGTESDLETLAKQLKTKCGVGGSVKDGQIVLQGDFKQKVSDTLKVMGYIKTKMG
ncbi:MAG: translation initiation factor [Sphingobacteriales bacterium]|nr:MAG: translation initiation factor [Sphingobacteriales bacterium]